MLQYEACSITYKDSCQKVLNLSNQTLRPNFYSTVNTRYRRAIKRYHKEMVRQIQKESLYWETCLVCCKCQYQGWGWSGREETWEIRLYRYNTNYTAWTLDCCSKKKNSPGLCGSVVECLPANQRAAVGFPGRARAWVVSCIPSAGCARGKHTLMFLSLSPSFPLSKK